MSTEHELEHDQLVWSGTRRGNESANNRLMGEFNRSIVINLIRQERSISRAEIAHRTKLSRSAVSNIITMLLEEGLVNTIGTGESSGGRRPIMLNFNYSAGSVLGIDIAADHLFALTTDLEGNILAQEGQPFNIDMGPELGLPIVIAHIRRTLEQHTANNRRVLGLGLGVPGPLDHTTGTVIAPPIMPGWDRFPLRQYLSREFNMPVLVENDANLAAVAEKWRGAAQGFQNIAYVKAGPGIGCGLILDNKVYRGQRGSAGEIGHITIIRDGPACRCGSAGCLESIAALPAIFSRARLAIKNGRATSLSHAGMLDDLTTEQLVSTANEGDKLARELFEDSGRYIGIALANLINLFNPGIVVLGGELAVADDLLMRPLRETVRSRSLLASYEQTGIVVSQLGCEAVALGAAMTVLQEVFRGPELALGMS